MDQSESLSSEREGQLETMPPFEASGVDSSGVVKKVTFEDMPLLERQPNETVRYTSPVHTVSKPFLEKEQAVITKDVKDPSVGAGKAGLFNLGNTCFMNSGLQCLFSNSPLVRYFLTQYRLSKVNEETLTGVFTRLLYKVWSSQYAIIHPLNFKETLGLYHPQFQDYRQHDCQEFLALLLDTLHEQLNTSGQSASAAHHSFPSTSWSKTLENVGYSTSCPSHSIKAESELDVCTANNKVLSATTLSGSIKRAGGNINIRLNRDIGMEGSISSIDSIRNIENPVVDGKSSLPSPINQSSHLNDDSNLSCQSSDSEHSVGLSQLKLKDQNKENHVSSSTDNLINSGINIATSSASDVKYSIKPTYTKEIINRPVESSLDSETPASVGSSSTLSLSEKNMEVSSSQESEAANSRMMANKSIVTSSDSTIQENQTPVLESLDSNGCASILNNASQKSRMPTLEELYSKDTKTLNTNVLATDYMEDDVQMDSEKFTKPDNVNRPQDALENVHVNELVTSDEQKKDFPRQVKDTNVQAENLKKYRISKNNSQSYEGDSDECFSINNVKRMKFEGTAKNVKRQALHKVNREKFLFHKSDSTMTASDPDSCSSDDDGRYDNLVEMAEEGHSSVSRDSPVDVPPDINSPTPETIAEADRAWDEYLSKNRSVVVDTFQGQFRSTVICSECQHISVTHEPFMYLSVPLPHAMERQISVIYISYDGPPTRYLFTLHKNDNVEKLKKELVSLVLADTCDIILAEVLDSHISRMLDDNIMLGYVNDTTRLIYAFKMLPAPPCPPMVEELEGGTTAGETLDHSAHGSSPYVTTYSGDSLTARTTIATSTYSGDSINARTTIATSTYSEYDIPQTDVFSNMGSFSTGIGTNEPDSTELTSEPVTPNLSVDLPSSSSSASLSLDLPSSSANTSLLFDPVSSYLSSQNSDMDTVANEPTFSMSFDDSVTTVQTEEVPRMNTPELDLTGATSWDNPVENPIISNPADFPASTWSMDIEIEVEPPDVCRSQQWRSCAICLEEMLDTDLKVHPACGGTLCQGCLEMSYKHYGDIAFTCPVCSVLVNPVEGFLPLAAQGSVRAQTRLLAIPVACRVESEDEGTGFKLVSHPNVVYLYNRISGQDLYDVIDRILPFTSPYTLSLTDGQGFRCSRCVYTSGCSGCLILREGETSLQPGDHITVNLPAPLETSLIINDKSMEKLRPKDPLTLHDCFTAFTQSEILDEHNPWYCPQCCQNQRAQKAMTVWRYPDTLIIHLKRFVFHELSSTKVDNKVVFPVDNLDLTEFLSGPRTKELYYDLHGIVCHFGGANAGHYTAYSKHPLLSQWFYYNDETVSERQPREEDQSSAYVLFYQRQGTDTKFTPLSDIKMTYDEDEACSSTMDASQPSGEATQSLTELDTVRSSVETVKKTSGSINAEDLACILQDLKKQKEGLGDSCEPDSTYDFYM